MEWVEAGVLPNKPLCVGHPQTLTSGMAPQRTTRLTQGCVEAGSKHRLLTSAALFTWISPSFSKVPESLFPVPFNHVVRCLLPAKLGLKPAKCRALRGRA